jgi:hypothetical protein
VVCLDRDLRQLQIRSVRSIVGSIIPIQIALGEDPWPFGPSMLGGILDIHFLDRSLFRYFTRSLRSGGYLLIETVGGYGGNYLELPKAGELRTMLRRTFDLVVYSEKKVGPREIDAVSVRLLAIKH